MTNEEKVAQACEEAGITEEVHTYRQWQDLGYQVDLGEHAIIRVKIKMLKSKYLNCTQQEIEEAGVKAWYLRWGCFFGRSQVHPIGTNPIDWRSLGKSGPVKIIQGKKGTV